MLPGPVFSAGSPSPPPFPPQMLVGGKPYLFPWLEKWAQGHPIRTWLAGTLLIVAGCELMRRATHGWFEHPLSTLVMVALMVSWVKHCFFPAATVLRHAVLCAALLGCLGYFTPGGVLLTIAVFPFAWAAHYAKTRSSPIVLAGLAFIVAVPPVLLYFFPGIAAAVNAGDFQHASTALAFSLLYIGWMRRQEPTLRFTHSNLALYLCPWNSPIMALIWGPKEWLKSDQPGLGTVCWGFQAALLLTLKTLLYYSLFVWFPEYLGDHLFGATLMGLSIPQLWFMAGLQYLEWFLLLSLCSDLVHAIARFAGFSLPANFRYPLLAWSPVELWRRWAVWNRLFLLRMIYFPLGGSQGMIYANILAVFLGSVLLFHCGMIGNIRWRWDPEYMGSWFLYLMTQGLLVCAEVAWWRRRGVERPKTPLSFRDPKRWVGMLLMQTTSIWLHVLILLPWGIGLDERISILFRMLGLG